MEIRRQIIYQEETFLNSNNYNWLDKFLLWRFHPRVIMAQMALSPWVVYFAWKNDWQSMLGIYVIGLIGSYLLNQHIRPSEMANTQLGRLALLHAHPANFSIQALGGIGLLIGVWQHSVLMTLGATTVILLGHLFGWGKINSAFR